MRFYNDTERMIYAVAFVGAFDRLYQGYRRATDEEIDHAERCSSAMAKESAEAKVFAHRRKS